ncbi:hypothetical protein ASG30_20065 [Ramlibacter sp. Leaf400]|nr:hypothetical protein ASG30_20065 [Ramlibacter sp. Leaf400]
MPATPSHQDPLQDSWRLEELTPDVRRRLFEGAARRVQVQRFRREGPGHITTPLPSERPQSH